MSSNRRVKLHREKLADRLAAERRKNAPPIGMAAVMERIAEHGKSESKQLELGEGARPNNMAPSKYSAVKSSQTVSSANIIYQGIDSIWFNYFGTIREDVLECLEWAKEDAQESESGEALSPLPPFDGTTPLMLGQGLPFYAYRALSQDVQVQLRKPNKKSPRPSAIVRVSAEALARLGRGGLVAARLAERWLMPLFEPEGYRVVVSHLHLATDYQGYVPAWADVDNMVSRAGGEGRPGDDDTGNVVFWDRRKRLSGIASGKSNNLRLNMYDKVKQVTKKGLTWVFDMWEGSAMYEAGAPTWRNEFQYGRSLLHAREIETMDDVEREIPALWGYGMQWASFRTPSKTDTNKSRWAVASWWEDLSTWGGVPVPALPKVKVVRPRLYRITAGLVGYLTTAMALTGLDSYQDVVQAAVDIEVSKSGPARLDRKLAAKRLRYEGFTMGAV
jgi:hypothetical protein